MVTNMNPLSSPEAQDNPYPFYAMARQFMPVLYIEQLGVWNVFTYEDCRNILRDPKRFSSDFQHGLPPEQRRRASMLNSDPPLHTRLRELVNRAFTPRMVAQLAPRIRSITDELLDAALSAGRMDLIPDLAIPLPVIMIAEILGVPPSDRQQFKRWSDDVASAVGGGITMQSEGVSEKTIDELGAYFTRIIEQRRAAPREDLISALLAAELDGEKLSLNDLLNFCVLLLVAGNETTTNLIGNAVRTLLEHPDEFDRLRAEAIAVAGRGRRSAALPAARAGHGAPYHGSDRAQGQPHTGGQGGVVWLAAANRDAAEFPNPDRFDITRAPNRHLAFGLGIHFCLGAPLARLEAAVALEEVGRRLQNLRLEGEPRWEQVNSFIFHGVRHMPVAFEA